MIELITHCTDTEALWAEIEETDATGSKRTIIGRKVPTVRNGDETLSLVAFESREEAEQWEHITVLGTYDEVLNTPELRAIYDRIYPRTPVTWVDEEGVTHTFTPPDKFGVMA